MYLSENLIKTQAEMMVKKGYLSVGYEYVIVDDCWLDHKRDDGGQLQPDPERFPSGIKSLADHVCNVHVISAVAISLKRNICLGPFFGPQVWHL